MALYKTNENVSFSSNNWCSSVNIHHIFKDACAEQWLNLQITAASYASSSLKNINKKNKFWPIKSSLMASSK